TAGARVDLPLLTGGARSGAEAEARAEAAAARASLARTAQLADLDARTAAARRRRRRLARERGGRAGGGARPRHRPAPLARGARDRARAHRRAARARG